MSGAAAMASIGIVGIGYAVPDTVRRNDDPLFAGERARTGSEELFVGFSERRVLAPGERVEDLGVRAARVALGDARVSPDQIDRLYGAVSPAEHLLPSGLYAIHEALGLRTDATVIPIQSEFTNFVAALGSACEAVAAGRCERALVVVATGWSRLVDYADPGALGIGDGAGAVVVARNAPLVFVDEISEVHASWRGAMTLQVRTPRVSPPGMPAGPRPIFVFEEEAARAYRELVALVPERLFGALLARHGLSAAEVALVTHQPSRAALAAWQRQLGPGELPSVLEELGNSTIATAVITLARHLGGLHSRHIVLLGLGLGQNFSAALLRRA